MRYAGAAARSSCEWAQEERRSLHAIDAEEPSYRPGSRDDFDRLYAATYQRVYGTLLTLLRDRPAAEDCTQEAFLRAYRAWPRWRPDAPAEAWVHRIAINVAISFRRRERLREVAEVVRRLGLPAQRDPGDDALGSVLLRELRSLPPKQAAALVLRHFYGYTNREIGQSLGIPERTVASRLIRAKALLRQRLGEPVDWRTSLAGGVPSDE